MYRYTKESETSLDGAMFAFVRNGDLEIILTIEAEKRRRKKAEMGIRLRSHGHIRAACGVRQTGDLAL